MANPEADKDAGERRGCGRGRDRDRGRRAHAEMHTQDSLTQLRADSRARDESSEWSRTDKDVGADPHSEGHQKPKAPNI